MDSAKGLIVDQTHLVLVSGKLILQKNGVIDLFSLESFSLDRQKKSNGKINRTFRDNRSLLFGRGRCRPVVTRNKEDGKKLEAGKKRPKGDPSLPNMIPTVPGQLVEFETDRLVPKTVRIRTKNELMEHGSWCMLASTLEN